MIWDNLGGEVELEGGRHSKHRLGSNSIFVLPTKTSSAKARTPEGVSWLADKEMLPGKIRDAQIIGLQIEIALGGFRDVEDFKTGAEKLIRCIRENQDKTPRVPVIIIEHCGGCFIIEQALVDVEVGILDATADVLFFGKPSITRLNTRTYQEEILKFKNLDAPKSLGDRFRNMTGPQGIPSIYFTGVYSLGGEEGLYSKVEMPFLMSLS